MKQIILAALGVLLAACGSETPKAPQIGLWVWSAEVAQHEFGLTVEIIDEVWQAELGSASVPITLTEDEIRIEGPDGQTFIGALSEDGSHILGYWHQPASDLAYSDMVTRIILTAEAEARWTGEFEVQPRPFHLFLEIFKNEDKTLSAALRNPERNEIMGAARFDLAANDRGTWALIAGEGDQERHYELRQITATELELDHYWFTAPVSLRRATDEDASKYYSRTAAAEPHRYTLPEPLNDGWRVRSPEDAGYDRARFDTLVSELGSADPTDLRPRMIHSVLVAHEGQLVLEEYFHGHTRDDRHDTRSLAKVFGPVLMGALRQQGYGIDPQDRPVAGILEAAGIPLDDPRKADITLAHLMSYTSGLDCDSASAASAGSEDNMWAQTVEPDFWRFTAHLDQRHTPGERYAYCSGSINLVASSLADATGLPLYEAFDQFIAEPLGFGPYHWNLAPNGEGYLGGGVYMRPRDILKIGVMFAANGTWQGEQIMSADWVEEATTPQIAITPETTGLSPEAFSNNYFGGQQAYVWRTDTVTANGTSYDSYEATGNGGQILLVVPELELAVVFTGGNYRWGSIWGRWRNEIVGGHIIPALNLSELD